MKVHELIMLLHSFPINMDVVALDNDEPMIVGGIVGVEIPESTGLVCVLFSKEDEVYQREI